MKAPSNQPDRSVTFELPCGDRYRARETDKERVLERVSEQGIVLERVSVRTSGWVDQFNLLSFDEMYRDLSSK